MTNIRWRSFAIPLLAAVVIAAGCGSGPDEGAADPAGGQQRRTVQHAMGSTEIIGEPKRIIALDPTFVDAAFSIDTPLVGFIEVTGSGTELPDYLGAARERFGKEAVSVGRAADPNLELIASLEPDLIVSARIRHESIYDELSGIAPTVFSETTGPTWKENLRLLARSVSKEELAEERIAAYERRARTIGDAIRAKEGRNPTVSVIRFLAAETRLYQKDNFSGIVLEDTGLARPPSQDVDAFAVEISAERILDADADHIYVTVSQDGEAAQSSARFRANPLWGRLTGRVFEVSDTVWGLAVGLQGAHAMLDDLARTFGVDPARS